MSHLPGLLKLIWRASPHYTFTLIVVMLLTGVVPTLSIAINARLLDALVRAAQGTEPAGVRVQPLFVLLLLLGAVALAGQVLSQVQSAVLQVLERRVTTHLQLLVADKAASLDLAFFEQHEFYNLLVNTAGDALNRPMAILMQLSQVATTTVTLAAGGFLLLAWQPWLVLIVLLGAIAKFWLGVRFGRARFDLAIGRTPLARKSMYLYTLLTSDEAAKEVRLFRLRGWLMNQYRTLLDRMVRQDIRLIRRQTLLNGALDSVLGLLHPAMIGFIAFQAIFQRITIGQFSLYTQLVIQLDAHLHNLMHMLAALYENHLFASNLFRFLALRPQVEADRPPTGNIAAVPGIEFRHVSFRYPGTTALVLDNISLQIAPGEKIALVGKNGAGKTTLVKLLAGLYEPTGGQIFIDGIDITTLDRQELRRLLSVTFQDYATYHFSAAHNIGFGEIERIGEHDRIVAAAQASGFDRIAERLPHGYESILGRWFEEGHELSGGQRQLLAIARAMMRSAPILILDEPSAALDIQAEQYFFDHILDRSGRQQTVLFIAHRFTSVRHADRILLIEQGRLREQGSHDELLRVGGRYAELFTLQASMYTPSGRHPEPTRTAGDEQDIHAEEVSL